MREPDGMAINAVSERNPGSWRLRAALTWLAGFVAAALALQLVVLTVDIGPLTLGTAVTIGISFAIAIGAGLAFWRLVAGRGQRPGLAVGLLVFALAWAGLGAFTLAWLFAEFNP